MQCNVKDPEIRTVHMVLSVYVIKWRDRVLSDRVQLLFVLLRPPGQRTRHVPNHRRLPMHYLLSKWSILNSLCHTLPRTVFMK
jgi:hypothetical protein